MRVHLKSQSALKTQLRAVLRDAGSARWTDAEVYTAMGMALDTWERRVSVPMLYTLTDGFIAGTTEYTLPSYIRPPFRPQQLTYYPYNGPISDNTSSQWSDITDWEVEPDGDDGYKLRVRVNVNTTDARILWYARNGRLPTTLPGLSSGMLATDTTLTVNAALDVADSGYVLVDAEWMQYAGLVRAASATQLTNLVRGVNESTVVTHDGAATVTWGVAAPSLDLFNQLIDQTAATLHQMFLGNASPNERDLHERMVSFYRTNADNFWRRYVPQRKPRIKPYYVAGG